MNCRIDRLSGRCCCVAARRTRLTLWDNFRNLEPHSMSGKGPYGLRRKLPLAAPDRVSETQVRLTDHERHGGEGIPASVRRGPPTRYRLWIRRIPRTCAARGRICLDKRRPESNEDSTHTIGKRTYASTSIEYLVEPMNHTFTCYWLNAWGRGLIVPTSKQKPVSEAGD